MTHAIHCSKVNDASPECDRPIGGSHLVVTLLAVPCGYVGWQTKIVRERKELLRFVVDGGGGYVMIRDKEHQFIGPLPKPADQIPKYVDPSIEQRPDERPSAFRLWLGDEAIGSILVAANVGESDLNRLKVNFPEAAVIQYTR
jgi:hypothetical protein